MRERKTKHQKKKKKSGAQSPRKYSREWEGEKTTGNNFK